MCKHIYLPAYTCRCSHTQAFLLLCVSSCYIHYMDSVRSSRIRGLISIMQDAGRDAMYLICFCLILSEGMCHIYPPQPHCHTHSLQLSPPLGPIIFSFLSNYPIMLSASLPCCFLFSSSICPSSLSPSCPLSYDCSLCPSIWYFLPIHHSTEMIHSFDHV